MIDELIFYPTMGKSITSNTEETSSKCKCKCKCKFECECGCGCECECECKCKFVMPSFILSILCPPTRTCHPLLFRFHGDNPS